MELASGFELGSHVSLIQRTNHKFISCSECRASLIL